MALKKRQPMGISVFEAAVDRMLGVYEGGHRVVVSFSGGKDSVCCLEVAIEAARRCGRLPVEVQFRDEEVWFPGTREILDYTAQRPEVRFTWFICHQPSLNIYNREMPYFWVYDPLLPAEQWMQEPPAWAEKSAYMDIEKQVNPTRFPPPEGKELYACIGLRVKESRGRLYGLFSSGSHLTKPNMVGTRSVRPIYDWSTGDVWKAILENKWVYHSAYDTLFRMGMKQEDLRIAPPTMNAAGIQLLTLGCKAWPRWFDKLCRRLPGLRTAAQFGKRSVEPSRALGETWEECFKRECMGATAPAWIQARAQKAMEIMLHQHAHHSTQAFPENQPCHQCHGNMGCWKSLAKVLYCGDPFSAKCKFLPYVQPEFFRKGAGKW